ncbi:hypothetical protein BH11CYA1_BH11CYA1_22180 [soil metagenome]
MSGSCPYCGAKLNYGIKFCVVCGRPITNHESGKTSKMGSGMRSGIRPADVTRRLDDLMTVARFKHSKRTTTLDSNMRWVSLNFVSVALGIALFFCAVKISLDGGLVKKSDKAITPLAAILTKLGLDGIGKKAPTNAKLDSAKPDSTKPSTKKSKTKKTNRKSH